MREITMKKVTGGGMWHRWITLGLLVSGVACSAGDDILVPVSPLVRFALPTGRIGLSITPTPLPPNVTVAQTWSLRETAGVGYDVTGVRIQTYRPDSTLQSTLIFTSQDIRSLWESPFIPPN